MLSPDEMKKAAKLLQDDRKTEMSNDAIDSIIDRETLKRPEAIDAALVDDALRAKYPESAPENVLMSDLETCRRLAHALKKESAVKHRRAAKIASIAAIVVMFFGATFGAASAFRWTPLLKFFQPAAEFFGVKTVVDTTDEAESYTDNETVYQQATYNALADMPASFRGYPVVLPCIPDGFNFVQGSIYQDENVARVSSYYLNGIQWLTVDVMICGEDEAATAYAFEKTQYEPSTMSFGNIVVTFYLNSDDNIMSASWIDRDAHYSIAGYITEDELTTISAMLYGGEENK